MPEDKKYFDVSRPRPGGPHPTSKPIIVGHHPTMPDPMIKEHEQEAAKPASIPVVDASSGTEALVDNDQPKTAAQPTVPSTQPSNLADISAPHELNPAPAASSPPMSQDSAHGIGAEPAKFTEDLHHTTEGPASPGTSFTPSALHQPHTSSPVAPPSGLPPTAQPQPTENTQPETELPQTPIHLPAGHMAYRHKPRIWVWVLAALILLAWIYAAVDALTATKLPYEFFKRETPVTQQPLANQPTTQETQNASAFQLPDGWIYYENKELGFKFAYPKEWGDLIRNNTASSEGRTQLHFLKKPYYIRIHDKDIEEVDNDDPIRNVKQLIDDNNSAQLIGGEKPDRILDTPSLCVYDSIGLNELQDTDSTDVVQYVYCSLANSSGVFILVHVQSPKETEKAIENEMLAIAESFQPLN